MQNIIQIEGKMEITKNLTINWDQKFEKKVTSSE
jgi:hypothetical protein